MKTMAISLFATALCLAQIPSGNSGAPSKTVSACASQPEHKTGAQQTIPTGAIQVEPYIYRYTDSAGETCLYRQTPFGIYKWAEDASAPAAQPVNNQRKSPVAVTDLGDSFRFERLTPFGKWTWTRKKTELNKDEKALVETQTAPSAPAAISVEKPAESR
jgi:hypothetical protein